MHTPRYPIPPASLPAECVRLLPGLSKSRPTAHFTEYGILENGRLVYRRNCAGIVNQCKALVIDPRVQPFDENGVYVSGQAFLLPEEEEVWHRMYRNDQPSQPSRSSKRTYEDASVEDLFECIGTEGLATVQEVCAPPSEGTECSEDTTPPSETPTQGSRMASHDNKHDPQKVWAVTSLKTPVPWEGGKRTFQGTTRNMAGYEVPVYRRICGGIVNWCKSVGIDPRVEDGVLDQAWLTVEEVARRRAHDEAREEERNSRNPTAPEAREEAPAAQAAEEAPYTDADLDRMEAEYAGLSRRLVSRAALRLIEASLPTVRSLGDDEVTQFVENRIASLRATVYVK